MKKQILMSLVSTALTAFALSAYAASEKREIAPEVVQKNCTEVAREMIGDALASDDGARFAIYDIDSAIADKLGIKLKNGEWMRAVAFNSRELDSPPATTNKILITRAEKYPATSCAVYDIGDFFMKSNTEDVLSSVEGRFSLKSGKIIFNGQGVTCPPPNRGGGSMRAVYELKGDKLIETKVVLKVPKCPN